MGLFVVSYDLIAGKDYQRIRNELERLGGVRIQLSLYLVNVNLDDSQVFLEHLRQFVDADDRLLVVKFTDTPKYTLGLQGTRGWIAANCPG
jgi:CRISPR-associated endonuclease Cas2